ncbi:MAG: hypothetical protein U9R38_08180 [Candidatus Margulisiibacteriota bacterium]|nr:hypothetical protein [Candidatus Margulisiibacteriota bacterium]
MKKIIVALLIVSFASVCFAMGTAPQPKIRTGDGDLDKALMEVEKRAGTADGAKAVRKELTERYQVRETDINTLRKQGYTLSGIYYCGLLSKQSGRGIREIAALRGQGVGWGVMAKRVGAKPADINKLRVRMRKGTAIRKKTVERKKERIKVSPAQPAPRMRTAPAGRRGR